MAMADPVGISAVVWPTVELVPLMSRLPGIVPLEKSETAAVVAAAASVEPLSILKGWISELHLLLLPQQEYRHVKVDVNRFSTSSSSCRCCVEEDVCRASSNSLGNENISRSTSC